MSWPAGPGLPPLTSDILLVIPTHNHPNCVPMAVASAQNQTIDDIDIVVLGDGVADDTRDALSPILAGDRRVRFIDFPKGQRHGEVHRDVVIRASGASVISYLGDDDLLFPRHLESMRACLDGVDFANPLPIFIDRGGDPLYYATDLANPASVAWHLHPTRRRNSVSLTGVTHTRESYLRLPHGWRPAPADRWADHYMWEQYFRLAGFLGRTLPLATTAKFEQSCRDDMTDVQRAAEIRAFADRMAVPDFVAAWNFTVAEKVRASSVDNFVMVNAVRDAVC